MKLSKRDIDILFGSQYKAEKILVLALARSGYHAVCHWLCLKYPSAIVFMNNCNHLLQQRNRSVYRNTSTVVKYRMYSFENFDLRGFKDLKLKGKFNKIIIINRDPYNWIASSLSKGQKLSTLDKPVKNSRRLFYSQWTCESMSRIDMFKQYMRQCLGEEDYLEQSFIDINYNRWFSDINYRMELCSKLGVGFSDNGLNYVSPRGGGSSFDKQKYSGRGSQMDVLNRWKFYKDDERFNQLLDDELKEYSRRYFNFTPYEDKKI